MDLQNTQADPEAAKYAELEKELGDWADEADQAPAKQAETEPKAADPESKKEAQPEPEKAKPDFEVLERNYKNVQGALSEARGEARSLKEQFQAQQKQLEALQDFLRQTVGRQQQDDEEFLTPEEKLGRMVNYLAEGQKQTQQQLQQMTQAQREQAELADLGRRAVSDEREFATKQADYFDAANHLANARMNELAIMLPDGVPQIEDQARRAGHNSVAEWRMAIMHQEQVQVARRAYEMGKNPAELIYHFAKQRGWGGKPTASAQPPTMQPIEAVRKGAQAAATLSNAGGGAPKGTDEVSHEELAQMFLDDPEAAERLWNKMARSGKLG